MLGRDAIGDAAAGAAEIEAEHEPGPLRRAAMIERIDAQRPMHTDDIGRQALDDIRSPGRQISEP